MNSNLSELLRNGLAGHQLELIRLVAAEATSRGTAVYLVGGVPRDVVMGRPATDLDVVVEGDAISLANTLAARYGGGVVAHRRFYTAKWNLEGKLAGLADAQIDTSEPSLSHHLDLISARSEVYQRPGELPHVQLGSIGDDLRRRDFTINTLAVRVDREHFGEVRDDFNALHDIERRIVRVLHSNSFQDDPTRMYRAVRYERRYGFRIDENTLKLVPEARRLVSLLSAQRLRRELDVTLEEALAADVLGGLNKLGLLKAIHQALPADKATLERVELAAESSPGVDIRIPRRDLRWLLWLLGVSAKDLKSISARLHFSGSLLAPLSAASALRSERDSMQRWRPSQVTAHLRSFPLPAVYAVYCAEARAGRRRLLKSYLTEWRHVHAGITGADLKKLGLDPGPIYQHVLRDLRDARLDGKVHTAAEERKRLDALLIRARSSGQRPPPHSKVHQRRT